MVTRRGVRSHPQQHGETHWAAGEGGAEAPGGSSRGRGGEGLLGWIWTPGWLQDRGQQGLSSPKENTGVA